ncbi:MAG: hypothetical protein LBR33_07450 [Propionibacteriaceae bacterium]|jgi:hypothetical protein|nr:hypothetical protein [Propionibacteriaceae bacterium]
MTAGERWRRRVNWANLTTLFGLLVARLGGAARRPGPAGLILAEGYRWRFPTGSAFTLGNVVVTRSDFASLGLRLPRLLDHEARHATQFAWLGLLFFPAYGVTVVWSLALTGDRAARCVFERGAGLADGGYEEVPIRALWRG